MPRCAGACDFRLAAMRLAAACVLTHCVPCWLACAIADRFRCLLDNNAAAVCALRSVAGRGRALITTPPINYSSSTRTRPAWRTLGPLRLSRAACGMCARRSSLHLLPRWPTPIARRSVMRGAAFCACLLIICRRRSRTRVRSDSYLRTSRTLRLHRGSATRTRQLRSTDRCRQACARSCALLRRERPRRRSHAPPRRLAAPPCRVAALPPRRAAWRTQLRASARAARVAAGRWRAGSRL